MVSSNFGSGPSAKYSYSKTEAKMLNETKENNITNIKNKIEAVKETMNENISITIKNNIKLENIEEKTQELEEEANIFRQTSNKIKNKMWWKKWKINCIVGFLLIIILIIIILVSYYENNPPRN